MYYEIITARKDMEKSRNKLDEFEGAHDQYMKEIERFDENAVRSLSRLLDKY